MMIYNVSSENYLNFLISNPVMNSFIVYRYNFNDEEIVEYYISFLKSLSLKLNP
jgi:protein CLEC16A